MESGVWSCLRSPSQRGSVTVILTSRPNTALQRTASGDPMPIVLDYIVALVAVTTGVEAAAERGR